MILTLEAPSIDMSAMQRMPLGEQLIMAGMLTEAQLDLARREQQRNGGRLAQIIVQLGFVSPELLAEFLGQGVIQATGLTARVLAPVADEDAHAIARGRGE